MYVLGIEGTAHTIGAGIVDIKDNGDVDILSNVRYTLVKKDGGMIPYEISEHHARYIKDATLNALRESGVSMKDIELMAYSRGPGFGSALQIVSVFSKGLSSKYSLPLIGVHHGAAHILIAKYLHGINDAIYLYVSGGNTQIISLENNRYFVVYGETEDIAIGNALDKLAREMGYGFPGGKIIEELAKEGSYVDMPYSIKGMDVSFSGILTYSVNLINRGYRKEDIAFSFQEHTFSMLTETVERALAYTHKEEVCVVGGVGMNNELQRKIKMMAEERGAKYYRLKKEYLGDNGAMIAIAGYHYYVFNKSFSGLSTKIKPKWRIENAFD